MQFMGNGASYAVDTNPQPHEANYLKLDCSKAKAELGWERDGIFIKHLKVS
jgi:CDP-glucose 4,6-dehydratase